jgi:4-hydroxybenzoate polyprenyltransferase
VVKDIEDMNGDARYGCRTMPIVWGVNAAKVYAATWLVVLTGSIAVIQVYVLQNGWWIIVPYSAILIIAPLIWILRRLYKAGTVAEYHLLSTYIKGVMLAGILSMVFIKIV